MDDRRLALALALGRIGLGGLLLVAPRRITELWLGRDARRAGTDVVARAMGARDLGLGVGTLLSLRAGDPARRWIAAGVLADATDLGATWRAGRALPTFGRLLTMALAGGGTLIGLRGTKALD